MEAKMVKEIMSIGVAAVMITLVVSVATFAAEEIIFWMGPGYAREIAESVKLFNDTHPDIKVKTQAFGGEERDRKLLVAIASNSKIPDGAIVWSRRIQRFIQFGGLVDITDVVKPIENRFSPVRIDNATGREGRIFSIPLESAILAMPYRQDILENHGLPVPEMWDEWITMGKKLKAKGIHAGRMDISEGTYTFPIALLSQMGGNIWDKTGKEVILGKPEGKGRQVVELMKKITDAGIVLDEREPTPAYWDSCRKGQIATSPFTGIWELPLYVDRIGNKPENGFGKWRAAPIPKVTKGDYRCATHGGGDLIILKGSVYKEAAKVFVEWLASNEEAQILNARAGELPALTSLLKKPELFTEPDPFEGFYGPESPIAVYAKLVAEAPPFPNIHPAWAEAQKHLGIEVSKMIQGKISIEEGIAELVVMIREIMLEY